MHGLVDMHTHLLPYVDDGAQNMVMARAMLEMQIEQGVKTIYLTPHFRNEMFETVDEKIENQFEAFVALAQEYENAPEIFLGREYYCDDMFFSLLSNGKIRPLGNGNCVLCEFSYTQHNTYYILSTANAVLKMGYVPIIAHVERYDCVKKNPEILDELSSLGALVQMNTSAILGNDGFKTKWFCRKLLKSGKIHLLASDSHNISTRKPNIGDCAKKIKRILSKTDAEKLLFENPKLLLKHITV